MKFGVEWKRQICFLLNFKTFFMIFGETLTPRAPSICLFALLPLASRLFVSPSQEQPFRPPIFHSVSVVIVSGNPALPDQASGWQRRLGGNTTKLRDAWLDPPNQTIGRLSQGRKGRRKFQDVELPSRPLAQFCEHCPGTASQRRTYPLLRLDHHRIYEPMPHMDSCPIWTPVPYGPLSHMDHCPIWTPVPYGPIPHMDPYPIWTHIQYGPIFHMDPYPIWAHIPYGPISDMDPYPIWTHIPYGPMYRTLYRLMYHMSPIP